MAPVTVGAAGSSSLTISMRRERTVYVRAEWTAPTSGFIIDLGNSNWGNISHHSQFSPRAFEHIAWSSSADGVRPLMELLTLKFHFKDLWGLKLSFTVHSWPWRQKLRKNFSAQSLCSSWKSFYPICDKKELTDHWCIPLGRDLLRDVTFKVQFCFGLRCFNG